VANYPSSFMWFYLMMLSMPTISSIPSMSKILLSSKTLNRFFNYFLYWSYFPSIILCPSKLERLYIMFAQIYEFPSMTDLMKLTKFNRSVSSNLITIPTSIKVILTFSVHFLTIYLILCSSAWLDLYSFLNV